MANLAVPRRAAPIQKRRTLCDGEGFAPPQNDVRPDFGLSR